MEDADHHRRASDYEKPRQTFVEWARANAVLLGGVTLACVIVFTGIVFYTRISDMIPVVATMRKDLDDAREAVKGVRADLTQLTDRTNELRAHLDRALEQAGTVQGKLADTDSKASELMGRFDERIKGLESHSPPLPFTPPGGHR